ARVDRLLGTALGAEEQRALLARVGIETEVPRKPIPVPVAGGPSPTSIDAAAHEAVVAVVPTWRRDIEIEADLAEEVARVRGYELTAPTLPATRPPAWQPSPLG